MTLELVLFIGASVFVVGMHVYVYVQMHRPYIPSCNPIILYGKNAPKHGPSTNRRLNERPSA